MTRPYSAIMNLSHSVYDMITHCIPLGISRPKRRKLLLRSFPSVPRIRQKRRRTGSMVLTTMHIPARYMTAIPSHRLRVSGRKKRIPVFLSWRSSLSILAGQCAENLSMHRKRPWLTPSSISMTTTISASLALIRMSENTCQSTSSLWLKKLCTRVL